MPCSPFSVKLFLRPWRWRRHIPPKHQLPFNGLHGVIFHKMIYFIITAVKTSNPTMAVINYCDMTSESQNSGVREVKWRRPPLGNSSVNRFGQQHICAQQQRNCWRQCFLFGTSQSYTGRANVTNMVMSPMGPRSKNDCAGEDQHQFTQLNDQLESESWDRKIWSWVLTEPKTRNDCAGEGQQQITRPDSGQLPNISCKPSRTEAIQHGSSTGNPHCWKSLSSNYSVKTQ
jgi:hypothetical protein